MLKMSLFMKMIRGSHNRTANQRNQRLQREALRKREDPTLYQVKQKLKTHPDPKYSTMTDEEMTREAKFLTDPESMKQLFSDLTYKPIQSILEEVSSEESMQSSHHQTRKSSKQKCLERVGQLTLKLHLSHLDESPSSLERLGAALLKIPYGVLHAALEIGDTSNPNVSYMLEFNESSLVQPRKKNLIETTALEATIPLGGAKLKLQDSAWPKPASPAEKAMKKKLAGRKTGIDQLDGYLNPEHKRPMRPRSICMTEKPQKVKRSVSAPINIEERKSDEDTVKSKHFSCRSRIVTEQMEATSSLPENFDPLRPCTSEDAYSARGLASRIGDTEASAQSPNMSLLQGLTTSPQITNSGEDLTQFIELSLSKLFLIEKLVNIIIKYNKCYYYNSISRNCQTFVIDVLQSFGVWENFTLGDRLEVYLKNLTKGRKEVYRSHKALNDRIKYLAASGELKETTYDEARYLRSLYTIFHLEESSASAQATTTICSDPECMLKVLEDYLKEIRPEGTTTLRSPEHYI